MPRRLVENPSPNTLAKRRSRAKAERQLSEALVRDVLEDMGADTVSVPSGARLKPVAALKAWLEAAGITEGPIFRPIRKGGRVLDERLTDRSVAAIVKKRVKAAGFDPAIFSGHSLRSGFVTTALDCGADALRVMDSTRHKSIDTLKIYDRRQRAAVSFLSHRQQYSNFGGKGLYFWCDPCQL